MHDQMPADPFAPRSDGIAAEILAEADLLWPAIEEARKRGNLLDAVTALSDDDLRTLVFEVALREAFRRERLTS